MRSLSASGGRVSNTENVHPFIVEVGESVLVIFKSGKKKDMFDILKWRMRVRLKRDAQCQRGKFPSP